MKIRTIISAIISVLTVLICSFSAFAEKTATPADAEISTTEILINAEANMDDKDITIIREEVSVDDGKLSESEVQINTDDGSDNETESRNSIAIDYADTYTDIPFTGSGKAIGFAVLAAVCSSAAVVFTGKKRKEQ